MPNPLTGDFEAVLQVSGKTINRLMASLHQNAFTNSETPSFPHSVQLRLGQVHKIDGVLGTVKAQVGTPRVSLIGGSTDRFWIEVPVRARYLPDAGTRPLPQYMNGTVRAQYHIADIDPKCLGWSKKAADHVWVRVVPETVHFAGTTEDEVDLTGVYTPGGAAEDHAQVEERVSRQVAVALLTDFQATPHPVSKRFRRGSLRSLDTNGETAVVAPVPVSGDPFGSIASVNWLFLQGADFGIAVSTATVMALAEPALAPIRDFHPTIKVHVGTPWPAPDIDTVYRVWTDPPVVEWHPYGGFAVIKIKVSGGANTDSILPNATFDIDQDITVNFDSGSERLWLGVGSRNVNAHVGGPFGGIVEGTVKSTIDSIVKPMIENACAAAQPSVDAIIGRKNELVAQLRTLDAGAGARIEGAEFLGDGMILRGRISVSRRQPPVVMFEKTGEGDALTAVKAWIPGGRIDKFSWSWTTYGSQATGARTLADRFVLRRQRAGKGRWGIDIAFEGTEPLPGVDVSGRVCLWIQGAQVNAVSGDLERVNSKTECNHFGFNIYAGLEIDPGPLFGHDFTDVPELSQEVPFPQLARVDLAVTNRTAAAHNTLIVHAGESLSHETAAAIGAALASSHRRDAGLALLALVPEGQRLDSRDGPVTALQRVGAEMGLATVVAEDVGGRWSRAFRLENGSARLLGPAGEVTWSHEGELDARQLTHALDSRLVTSPSPNLDVIGDTWGIDKLFPIGDLLWPIDYSALQDPCPPFPWSRGSYGTVVTFVPAVTDATMAHLRNLAARYDAAEGRAANLVVVLGGAGGRESEVVAGHLGERFTTVPDSDLRIARRAGIRVWPTTMTLDRQGRIGALETGIDRGPARTHDEPQGGERPEADGAQLQ